MIKIGRIQILAPVVFVSLMSALVFGADDPTLKVVSIIDRDSISMGEEVTLTVSVQSKENVDVGEPRVPDLDGFQLLNTWSGSAVSQKLVQTNSGMQFETVRRKEFSFLLSPRKEGRLGIGAFEVVVEGKVYKTKPVVVTVSGRQGAPTRPGQKGGRQIDPFNMPDNFEDLDKMEEDMFNQLLQNRRGSVGGSQGGQGSGGTRPDKEPEYRSLPTNPNEAFFIQVEVDKTEAYVGEPIIVSWYYYTRSVPETLERLKFPNLRGFWKETIEEVPSLQFEEEVVNGLPYRKALLATHALFPIKAGEATIDEYKVRSRVRSGNFGFGGESYEYSKSSKPVKIKVKDLPIDGRPKDFTGAVGQFEVSASLEGNEFPVNQPFSFKVRFEGSGNAKMIDLPAIKWPSSIELYNTKMDSKFFKNGKSYKEFEILLIPRETGTIQLPEFSVSLFDPKDKKYYTRKIQGIEIKINPAGNSNGGQDSRLNLAAKANPTVVSNEPQLITQSEFLNFKIRSLRWVWPIILLIELLVLAWLARGLFFTKEFKVSVKREVDRRLKRVTLARVEKRSRDFGIEGVQLLNYLMRSLASGQEDKSLNEMMGKIPLSLRKSHEAEIRKVWEAFEALGFAPEELTQALRTSERLVEHEKNLGVVVAAMVEHLGEVANS